ncbi:MAG: serine hydrolase [Steroidobacteraceae bacterium]
MFRRLLIILAAVLLVGGSTVVAAVIAQWPYVSRLWRVSASNESWSDVVQTPRFALRARARLPLSRLAGTESFAAEGMRRAADWASQHGAFALLVAQGETVLFEQYWQGKDATSLLGGGGLSRSLVAMLYGIAVAEGRLQLTDEIGQYLDEWRGDARRHITVQQLLENTSGLEDAPPALGGDNIRVGLRSRLEFFVAELADKNARLKLGNNFAAAALLYKLQHEPGLRFALSDANAQLAAVVLERAMGQGYAELLAERIWQPMGAANALMYMDRPSGMPAAYCCLRARAEDFLRLGILLANEGVIHGQRILPAGWVARMASGSRSNPNYGLQLWTSPLAAGRREFIPGTNLAATHGDGFAASDVIWMEGPGGAAVWASPSQDLAIVYIGGMGTDFDASVLVNLILRARITPTAAAAAG